METSTNLQQINVYEDIQAEQISQTEVRKTGRGTKPPLWLKDFVSLNIHEGPYSLDKYVSYISINPTYQVYLAKMSSVTEPQSYKEAASDPKWTEAMNAEIKALQDNHTWEVVELPDGKTPIGCRWIFKVKYKSNGEVERFKARLVAKGYSQKEGIDYQETFSPVVKMKTVRTVLAIAAPQHWQIHQMDVFNAFLQGDLPDEIYMQLPQGFESQGENKVCMTH